MNYTNIPMSNSPCIINLACCHDVCFSKFIYSSISSISLICWGWYHAGQWEQWLATLYKTYIGTQRAQNLRKYREVEIAVTVGQAACYGNVDFSIGKQLYFHGMQRKRGLVLKRVLLWPNVYFLVVQAILRNSYKDLSRLRDQNCGKKRKPRLLSVFISPWANIGLYIFRLFKKN